MKKLISMTDFVFYIDNNREFARNYDKILAYANFLKQPLELWMFVPCDEDGNVLEEKCIEDELCKYCPLESSKFDSKGNSCEGSSCDVVAENYTDQYQQAKERCLFFSWHGENEMFDDCSAEIFLYEFYNIEQLSNDIREIKLTPTALKQIGL